MKQRYSSLDIKVIAHELSNSIVSLRANNIYDLSSRIFLFKFQKPGHKEHFLIDSGFRCHLTSFARTTANTPSAFVQRLRKYLRDRRLTAVSQVGTDRILELQFSDGRYRLFLEFYAGGNIVLTDNELKVIALLRQVNEGSPHEQVQVGSSYNLSERQNIDGIPPLTEERLRTGLQSYIDKQAAGQASSNKKLKKKPGDVLRKSLASFITEYPPMLVDHALRLNGFDIALQPEEVLQDDSRVRSLLDALMGTESIVDEIMSAGVAKGYIFGKASGQESSTGGTSSSSILYNDFHPFKPKHLQDDPTTKALEFDGFNRTVDEFYSSIEGQKLESRLAEKEQSARKKIENAKSDQAKRLGGLQEVQALNVRKAAAIEANLARVEETSTAINGLIAQGKDWDEIEKLIEMEKKRGNPVAEIVKLPLKLNENTATMLLGEWEEEEDAEDAHDSTASEPSSSDEDEVPRGKTKTSKPQPVDKRLAVDIDLALSPWGNAREYYDQKKTAAAKEEKTLLASAKALKSTEKKVQADLSKALKQEKQVLRPVRQPFWFEKFVHFLSSDGYLVLGAKDAQQSEILYRRYLKRGDVFVHAELDGAMMVIIKNHPGNLDAPIPPSTLSQAGNMSIATSTAWDSKAVMSAWWVREEMVSKKAPTGDLLGPGKFAIKGDKNFLPPAQLLLGFAVLFYISEESKMKHLRHRVSPADESAAHGQERLGAETADGDGVDMNGEDCDDDDDATDSKAQPTEDKDASENASDGEDGNSEHNSADEDDTGRESMVNPLQPSGSADMGRESAEGADDEMAGEMAGGGETASQSRDGDSESETEVEGLVSGAPGSSATSVSGQSKSKAPVRGKRGKKKKMASKYAEQDEEDREQAMRLLGSAAGQQRAKEEAAAKEQRDKEAAAARQRRREQHHKAQLQHAEEREVNEGDVMAKEDEADEAISSVDLGRFVGRPLAGDDIIEALPLCAPWNALGRYKYKAKMQPGSTKKGKAVREVLSKWASDGANKRNVDERAEDTERMWPREVELMKNWKETEVFGVVPVGKVRVMMAGASAGGGKDKKGKSQKGRGGRGSKKQ